MKREKYRLDKKSFIERSNNVHNYKYDYSNVEYVNVKTKVCIICPIHGEFWQSPKNHMKGQGCPECGKEASKICHKHNYQKFVDAAKAKYGNSFSFPEIEKTYINNKTHVYIKCNECGYVFTKRPNDFLNDKVFKGCKNCKKIEKERKKHVKVKKRKYVSKEEFEKRMFEKFNGTIVPCTDEYVNTQIPITFKCNTCGNTFKRKPSNMLINAGCPKCIHLANNKLTTEEFIERANKIHNFKYDYSESEYKTTDEKVKIICHEKDKFGEEHGAFYVTPHSHIGSMKSGCPKCSGKFRKDTNYFIKQAVKIHGDKYIYTNTHYKAALKKVEIICSTHGSFWITPNDHLNGRGCPYCRESHLENEIRTFLNGKNIKYVAQARFDWLKTNDTNKKMSLDFYLPDYNIAIECQGIQHFEPNCFWGDSKNKEEKIKRVKERDELKRELCNEHGIKLLYYSNLGIEYPYQVFENKEELLKEIVK